MKALPNLRPRRSEKPPTSTKIFNKIRPPTKEKVDRVGNPHWQQTNKIYLETSFIQFWPGATD